MISLGRWGETMKPACMTLSHSPSRRHLHLSVFPPPSLPFHSSVFLSTPLCLFFFPLSSGGKCIDSPLFVVSPTHIQLSQRECGVQPKLMETDLGGRGVRAVLISSQKMKPNNIHSHYAHCGDEKLTEISAGGV